MADSYSAIQSLQAQQRMAAAATLTSSAAAQWRLHDVDGTLLISDTVSGIAGSWQTWSLNKQVPAGATHVSLECWSLQNDPNGGTVLSNLSIRANAGATVLLGCAGRSAGTGDATGSVNQGIYPVNSDQTIQYNASTDFLHWQIRLIGYWK